VFILFSRRHLAGSDDAELAGWCVVFGLGLSATAAFLAERLLFPKSSASTAEFRFVVLRHDGIDDPHFDLMLETATGSSLTTWRSPVWPITEPTNLLQLADHRRDYLEYEGKISADRGFVKRIESGNYRITNEIAGGRRLEWCQGTAPPLLLRRLEDNRWLASTI
jgi:hypothetical protein